MDRHSPGSCGGAVGRWSLGTVLNFYRASSYIDLIVSMLLPIWSDDTELISILRSIWWIIRGSTVVKNRCYYQVDLIHQHKLLYSWRNSRNRNECQSRRFHRGTRSIVIFTCEWSGVRCGLEEQKQVPWGCGASIAPMPMVAAKEKKMLGNDF